MTLVHGSDAATRIPPCHDVKPMSLYVLLQSVAAELVQTRQSNMISLSNVLQLAATSLNT